MIELHIIMCTVEGSHNKELDTRNPIIHLILVNPVNPKP